MVERRPILAPAPEPALDEIEFRELRDLGRYGPRWKTLCHPMALPSLHQLGYIEQTFERHIYYGDIPCWAISPAGLASLRARGALGQCRR